MALNSTSRKEKSTNPASGNQTQHSFIFWKKSDGCKEKGQLKVTSVISHESIFSPCFAQRLQLNTAAEQILSLIQELTLKMTLTSL